MCINIYIINIFIYVYTHTHIYIYIHICMYIYVIYIYIYINLSPCFVIRLVNVFHSGAANLLHIQLCMRASSFIWSGNKFPGKIAIRSLLERNPSRSGPRSSSLSLMRFSSSTSHKHSIMVSSCGMEFTVASCWLSSAHFTLTSTLVEEIRSAIFQRI
jgi:hypothetical protein